MSTELWSLYIAGPDDLVAMPSKAVAEAVARNFNAVWERYGTERDIKVHAVAHVEPWMHGKAAHTKDLREHFHEYADLVLDEDAARFKPAQPVQAVGAFAPIPEAVEAPTPELWRAYEAFNDAYKGFNTQQALRAAINGVLAERAALAHPRPTVSPEPRDSDLHAAAPGQHHEIALAVWEHMNRRSAPGVIMTMAYTAVLHALSKATPTVEQAGEATCERCGATSDKDAENRCIPDGDSCPGCEEPLHSAWQAGEVVEAKWPGPWNGHRFPVDAIAKVFGKAAFEAASILRLGPPNHSDIGIALLQQLGSVGFGICRDQPRNVGVPDEIVKLAAIECARRAYGYWKGDSTGGDSAMRYFDGNMGLAGISHNIDMMESAIRKHIAAAPAPGKGGAA